MRFDNCKVFNMQGALRGMRNPKNSWHLSDSIFGLRDLSKPNPDIDALAEQWVAYDGYEFEDPGYANDLSERRDWITKNASLGYDLNTNIADVACIGPKDMKLATQLIKGGTEHRKFLRQIFVTIDITAPLYWWKEADTYKVATTANSTSTMHKLASKPITIDCFEIDDWENITYPKEFQREDLKSDIDDDFVPMCLIPYLEYLRQQYLETQDTKYWKELVRWLPESWLQTRTWTANYETLRSIYRQRRHHKLSEWHQFCDFIETLPYAKEFIVD